MTTYKVRTEIFEGPFDLLLHLVGRQKLDINHIPIAEIADEFVEHIDRMKELDLDVASDFLLVAATLLELKAASLLPREEQVVDEEFEDLSPQEARDLLIARLLAYKQFKNVAGELGARMEAESHMHPREAGLEPEFLKLMPDYLEGVTLRGLAVVCADIVHKREIFLLQAEHVASMPLSLDMHMESVARTLRKRGRATFAELIAGDRSAEEIVVTFLAILELYKRGRVDLAQAALFGDIEVVFLTEEDLDDE
jgi:segregation and condensation protein A